MEREPLVRRKEEAYTEQGLFNAFLLFSIILIIAGVASASFQSSVGPILVLTEFLTIPGLLGIATCIVRHFKVRTNVELRETRAVVILALISGVLTIGGSVYVVYVLIFSILNKIKNCEDCFDLGKGTAGLMFAILAYIFCLVFLMVTISHTVLSGLIARRLLAHTNNSSGNALTAPA